MKLISGTTIKESLRQISPIQIAVAYVGKDWENYIDANFLKELIVSPTLGTNPYAAAHIARKLGWNNVHFLDNLHAKIYIGNTQAAIGSFNLTTNGLSSEGLEEAGFFVETP